jgi:outer membrane protein assembly factor BamB
LGLVGGGRLYAQAPSWVWAKSVGNAQSPRIAVDASGNVYVTGSFSDDRLTFGSITLIRNKETTEFIPRADMFVVKYDPNGQVLWAKSAGGSEDEYARDIAVDARGNVYVIGEFQSDGLTLGCHHAQTQG